MTESNRLIDQHTLSLTDMTPKELLDKVIAALEYADSSMVHNVEWQMPFIIGAGLEAAKSLRDMQPVGDDVVERANKLSAESALNRAKDWIDTAIAAMQGATSMGDVNDTNVADKGQAPDKQSVASEVSVDEADALDLLYEKVNEWIAYGLMRKVVQEWEKLRPTKPVMKGRCCENGNFEDVHECMKQKPS